MIKTKIVVKRVAADSYKVAKITNPRVNLLDDLDKRLTFTQLKQYVRERHSRDTTVEVHND